MSAGERFEGDREPIAIVGFGCRLPGAEGPEEFWDLLAAGHEAVGPTREYRAKTADGCDPRASAPGVRVRGHLNDVESFDWRAFRMSPREGKYVDPQQRLILEVAWEALEHAGIPFERVAGTTTAVFAGVMWPDYAKLLAENTDRLAGYAATGAGFALVANRVSHFFDLRGPSVTVDVQCASSLTAVHLACSSIWSGDCDQALVGGVNLILTPDSDVILSRAGVLSRSGRCRPFDAGADGYVRSEGAGMVVLKPLRRATADGDRVWAVIRGSAINHDGRGESLTAPSCASQRALLARAYSRAGADPAHVDYVELHGTGTQKGDPIEAQALSDTLSAQRDDGRPCLVGSVKSNLGHSEAAAGISALMKIVLAMNRGQIPPTLHNETLNPAIRLGELNLSLVKELTPWPETGRRPLAGVTGLSLGGANAHVVVEGAPAEPAREGRDQALDGPWALPVSARTDWALAALARRYAEFLRTGPSDPAWLADVCFTAGARRTHHERRAAAVAYTREGLAAQLDRQAELGDGLEDQLPPSAPAAPAVVFAPAGESAAAEAELVERFAVAGIVPAGEAEASGPVVVIEIAARPRSAAPAADRGDVTVLPEPGVDVSTREGFVQTLAALYALGCRIDWSALHDTAERRVVTLPRYAWQRERLWLDPAPRPEPEPVAATA